jgi:hypothetical protein
MNQNERIKNAQAQANRMRNRAMKTTIIFLVVAVGGIALFVNFLGSGDSKDEKEVVKTEFSSCNELKDYLGWSDAGQHAYKSFSDLKEKWGEGIKISDPFCNSELCYVNVLFENVKVNGSSVYLIFESDETGDPFSWCTGFDCDKIGKTPTIKYN